MFQQIHEELQLDSEFPFAIYQTSERQQFLHFHDSLELNIVERGEGNYIIGGKRYLMQPGDIFVINNKEPHMAVHKETPSVYTENAENDINGLKLTVLVFDMNLLWRNKGVDQFLTPFLSRKEQFSHRIAGSSPYYPQMVEMFRRIAEENENREKGWQMAVEALLMYLLTLIYRCYDEKQELYEERDNFQKMYARISAVFDYIGEHFKENIALEQMAQLVALSPHYLCKCFKKVTGRTIFEYIEQMRVQHSCYLLRTTDSSVMEIAMESGFNTVSYYNRIFKKYSGQTPKEYRRKNKKT